MQELIKEENEAKNLKYTEPTLKLKLQQGRENFYKKAEEHDVPNAQFIDTPHRKQFDLKP